MKIDQNLLQCAQINFENFEKAFPLAKKHPYYLIAKAQFDEGLGGPTVEETLKPHMKSTTIKFGSNGEPYTTDGNPFGISVDGKEIENREEL